MVQEIVNATLDFPLFIRIHGGEYKNKDAFENVIRYITRTRNNENRQNELIFYGTACGYPSLKSPEKIIKEFEYIARSYGTRGSFLVHYTIGIYDSLFNKMGNSFDVLAACMVECCRYIHNIGYQSCYAVHISQEKKLHVHLVISTTNFRTGRKLNQYPFSISNEIERPLLDIFNRYTINQLSFSQIGI